MASLTDRHYYLMAVALYGASLAYSLFLWRKGFRKDNRVNYAVLALGFAWHTAAMLKRGISFSRCPVNNLYEAVIFIAWTILFAYLVLGSWSRLRFLGVYASPILFGMGVFAFMPGLDTDGPKSESINFWRSLHAAFSLLSYGAFGLSSIAAVMYLTQEHDLKLHKLRAVMSLLPPMQRLEVVISRLLVAGFGLLTIGLLVGAYWLKQYAGVYFKGDFKILWSAFVWLLYLGLLVWHWRYSQGGRRFAWGALGSFLFVMLTFWGSNLASPIHR